MENELHVIHLIPAYVLDCLEGGEEKQVKDHLAICAHCQAELLQYQELVAKLALAVPQIDPPPGIKSRLMERADASLRSDLENTSRPGFLSRLLDRFPRFLPAWALASLVLVVGLLISNIVLWQWVNHIRAIEASGTMRVVTLKGSPVSPSATGMLVISKDGTHGTLVVDDLPALAPDQQYQLWLIMDEERTSGAVFSVNAGGYGSVWVSSPLPLIMYQQFGVTIEPKGGSPGPTGENVLRSDL